MGFVPEEVHSEKAEDLYLSRCIFIFNGGYSKDSSSKMNPKFGKCYFDLITNLNVFGLVSQLVFVIISFILVLSYVRIIYFLWKRRSPVERISIQASQNQSTREKRTTILMALIVGILYQYNCSRVGVWSNPIR